MTNHTQDKTFTCPNCGTEYTKETPCGYYRCSDLDPRPVAVESATQGEKGWEEEFDREFGNINGYGEDRVSQIKTFISRIRAEAKEEGAREEREKLLQKARKYHTNNWSLSDLLQALSKEK